MFKRTSPQPLTQPILHIHNRNFNPFSLQPFDNQLPNPPTPPSHNRNFLIPIPRFPLHTYSPPPPIQCNLIQPRIDLPRHPQRKQPLQHPDYARTMHRVTERREVVFKLGADAERGFGEGVEERGGEDGVEEDVGEGEGEKLGDALDGDGHFCVSWIN